MLVVHQLAGVLLDMDALDADLFGRLGLAFQFDLDRTLADQRVVELADLIALRQIGVEIILAIEPRPFVDLGVDRHAGAHRLADAFAVGHRQHAGHRRIDQRHLRIGFGAEFGRRAGEQFGLRGHLCVHLEPDDHFPVAGGATDAVCRGSGSAERFGHDGANSPSHAQAARHGVMTS